MLRVVIEDETSRSEVWGPLCSQFLWPYGLEKFPPSVTLTLSTKKESHSSVVFNTKVCRLDKLASVNLFCGYVSHPSYRRLWGVSSLTLGVRLDFFPVFRTEWQRTCYYKRVITLSQVTSIIFTPSPNYVWRGGWGSYEVDGDLPTLEVFRDLLLRLGPFVWRSGWGESLKLVQSLNLF